MGLTSRRPPSEEEIQRWSREDQDDWGDVGAESWRLVYPVGVDPTDVAAVRRAIGMTPAEFAHAFGVSVTTIRRWESGRSPQGPARALLRVIAREPAAVRRALAQPGE